MNNSELAERLTAEFRADQRVRGAWLTGSIARGVDDEYSDVDTWVVVGKRDRDSFTADWPAAARRVAPLVLLQRRDSGSTVVFNQVTDEWLRFDVIVGLPEDVPKRSRALVRMLFDRDGLAARLQDTADDLLPDPARVRALTTEFLRVLGLLPVVLGREEYVLAVSGAGLLRTMLIDLMLQDVAVPDRGGALHLKPLLPAGRMTLLRQLPPLAATRSSVIAMHVACAEAFMPLARSLAERTGLAWPSDLERAARNHLRRLGIEFS